MPAKRPSSSSRAPTSTPSSHFLAGIAQLPDQTVTASFSNHNGKPIAIMLRGLGMTRDAAAAVGKARARHLNLPEKDVELWLDEYDRIGQREAERSIQMLREKEAEEASTDNAGPQAARTARHR